MTREMRIAARGEARRAVEEWHRIRAEHDAGERVEGMKVAGAVLAVVVLMALVSYLFLVTP